MVHHHPPNSHPELPPPPPPPPVPPRPFAASFSLRWALGNRNRNAKIPRRFQFGRLPLPTTGGVNPVLRLGLSPLNPARRSALLINPEPNSNPNRFAASPPKEKILVEPVEGSENTPEDKGTNNLLLRFCVKKRDLSAPSADPEPEPQAEAKAEVEEAEVLEEGESNPLVKTWNLRPRKVVEKKTAVKGRNGGSLGHDAGRTRSRVRHGSSSRGKNGGLKELKENGGRRKEEEEGVVLKTAMLSLTLTKEEIEEDFLKVTAAKPPKKPNKRPRAVQKQLDAVFPGLWLTSVSVTPDLYQVPDPPLKIKLFSSLCASCERPKENS
ncbi:hypothetical protein HN51_021281 [Arachis hypogaea]